MSKNLDEINKVEKTAKAELEVAKKKFEAAKKKKRTWFQEIKNGSNGQISISKTL